MGRASGELAPSLPLDAFSLNSGISSLPRWGITTSTSVVSGRLALSYFQVARGLTVSQIRTFTAATAAATPTLCRVGIYSVAANGDLTLAASIANDTTIWNAVTSTFTRSLTASLALAPGATYAFGQLYVGTTVPTWPCASMAAIDPAETAISPRVTGSLTGQTDLPGSITAGSVGTLGSYYYLAAL